MVLSDFPYTRTVKSKHANDITPKTKKITPKELNPAFKLKPETIKTAIIASIKEIIFER
jgi:hypothetical protein